MGYNDKEVMLKKFQPLYEGLKNNDVEKVVELFEKLFPTSNLWQSTLLDDTPLQIAVSMDREGIARALLTRCIQNNLRSLITHKNCFHDTILHEVAKANMISLARDLLVEAPELLSVPNKLGEMPLFGVAHNGNRKMFDLLAQAVHTQDDANLHKHLIRSDNTNILHLSILSEHFDLAFVIAKKYPDLLVGQDDAGKIGLQLLSNNPLAFRSGKSYGWLKSFIFKQCIPTFEEEEKEEGYEEEDLKDHYEVDLFGHEDRDNSKPKGIRFTYVCNCMPINVASALRKINISIWKFLRGRWPMMTKMYDEHRKHESALRLAKFLIKRDMTWDVNLSQENKDKISLVAEDEGDRSIGEYEEAATKLGRLADLIVKEHKGKISLGAADKKGDGKKGEYEEAAEKLARLVNKLPTWKYNLFEKDEGKSPVPQEVVKRLPSPPTSLLVATTNGIVEIVEEILSVFPQAIEHVSDAGQNILHVAIKHRQLEIFYLVTKKMGLSKSRLVRRIDSTGYTLLHQACVTRFYTGTLPGPAFQLQEELCWLERVRKIIPPHYIRHRSNKYNETAEEFFRRQHKPLLKEAQDWLKRTSESCSTVAVLIATVAFAAAYTIPGGSNPETGVPILLHDPFFLVFTVMDVLSLASSLTSVVMFLSILTSPFELQDFHRSLPRKLTLGFTFLFFSVAATMLAFAATIVLTVHLKKRWITTLIYSLAFLPVSVFALLQFPLYLAFKNSMKYSWKLIRTNHH